MAYIGNRPVSGDNNSFRVLDDIKTHTFSFDGSSSSVVSTSDNTITHIGHRLIQGQRVTYTDGTGSAIGGLSDGTVYFVIINDANSFKLASSASNAAAGTAINLTSVGSGTSHNINVAFDGVNTKFKATFNNGTEADVTRVAQIQISLDNVIQQPQNTATPTSGFGFESDSVIVFATAPASNATFWGILFANNFPTFEISDNDVDNFTGDGSKTEFSLSKSPASNENIIVTIDGVVQYPSDNSTTRAYNTVGNALQFSSAPANGADIQARHIGFAGPDESGGVTAFYGRTGSVFLNNSDNIVVNNAEVAGNLTVQGTMTTLDTKVTEVDQLEVAANNSTVGVAITQSGSGDILKLYDSSTPVFVVKENGKVGIGTDNPNAQLDIEGEFARIDLHDYDGNQSQIIQSGGALFLNLDSEGNGNGALRIRSGGNSGVNEIIRIKPDGTVGIGSTTPTEKLDVIGNIKSSGTITASSFVGGLPITNGADNRVITATSASAIQGEAGLTFDGTTLSNAGTGFKGITIAPSTNNSATLRLQNSVKNFSVSNVTGGKFAIADGSTQRFIIDGSGNVGVGTNSITTRFEIEGTAALTNHNQTLIIRDSVSDDAPGRGGNIGFGAYVNGTMRTLAAIGAFKKNSGTGFDGHLALYTRRNGIGPVDEVMRLESGGDVGIGTTNPVGKLHLFAETGDCVLTLEADRGNSNSNENDNPYIVFRQDGSTQNSAIGMNPNGITGESNSLVLVNGASSGGIIFKTGSGGNFTSGTSEKMRILPDGEIRISDGGKITINTSVSGNYALQEALRVDDGNFTNDRALQIFEYHNNGVRWHSFNQNLDVTTTGTSYTYTQGNYGGSNMIEMNQGDLKIYNNPEVVSAGTSAITPTERIRVRSDGKVLIGSDLNATPYDDRKLTINSTSNNYLSIQSGDSSFSGIVFGHNSGQSTDNFLTYVRHNNVDNAFAIHTNSASTPKVIITSDGSVGIGTNNPTQKLEVKYGEAWIDNSSGDGTARSDGLTVSHAPNSDFTVGADPTDNKRAATFAVKGSSRAAIVTLRNVDDSNAFWDFIADGNTNKFYIQRGSNNGAALGPAVTIDTDLNVGIGTDDPKTKLNVYTHPHSDTGGILVQNANYTSNLNKAYLIAGTQTWTGATTDWSTYGFQHKLKTDSGGVPRLTIDTSGGGGSIKEIITFMTSGNVGIGSVADEKLHVVVSSSTPTAAKFERSHNNNVAIEYRNTTSRMYAGLAGDALGWAVDNDANLGNLPMFMVRRTTGFVGVGVVEPLRKLDVIGSGSDGISILARPTTLNIDSSGNADSVNNSIIIRMPYGENPSTTANAGARFGIQFTGANNTTDISSLNWGDDPVKSASIYGVSEDSGAGFSRKVGLAFYTSNFDIAQRERLRIKSDGNVGIGTVNPTSLLTVGARPKTTTANATVLISPASGNASIQLRGGSPTLEFDGTGGGNGQIFTDSADLSISNGTIDGAGTELVRITSGGQVNIGTGNLNQTDRMLNVYGGRIRIEGISSGNSFEILNSASAGSSFGILCQAGTNSSDINATFRNTSGATLFRIRGDGNIGIGTVSPAHKLDIIGDAAIEGDLFLSDVSGQIVKFDGTGGNLDVYSDGTIDFIESDNNKTMVTFDINTVHDDARIYLEGDIDTYLNHPNSNQLGFTIGGSDTMRLKASQVGIGTVNPTSLLHLMGGDCRLRWSKSDAGADLKNWDFSAQGEIFRIQAKNDADSGGGNIFDFHRTTNQINEFRGVQSGNTWFVVDNLNREVGIRTDNPAAPLHVETAVNQSTIAIFGSTNTTSGATYQALLIRNDVTGYPALCNASSSDVLDVRSAGSVQVTIDDNNNDTAKFFRVMVNGLGNAGTEVFKVNETGLTTLKNFNGTGLKLEGSGSDYQGMQLQVTDASASQTRNIFIDTVNESGNAVANQVGQIQSDGGSHWSWSTQTAGNRNDRRVERVRITADGELGINTNTNNTSVLSFRNSVKDHKIGGVTVVLADDTISGDITLPGERHGCLLTIFAHSDTSGTYPQPGPVGFVYVDVGASTNIRPMFTQGGTGADATTTVGNNMVGKNSHETNISNCDDGKLTIMKGSADGKMKLANRLDSTYHFYLTMM